MIPYAWWLGHVLAFQSLVLALSFLFPGEFTNDDELCETCLLVSETQPVLFGVDSVGLEPLKTRNVIGSSLCLGFQLP